MTPRAVRDRHRRIRAQRHQFDILFTRAARARREADERLSDEEYMERVKQRIREISWWAPRSAPGVKRVRLPSS